jgi:hypothetical protein
MGSRYDLVARDVREEIAAVLDEDLPIYTVLVPVFREARVVGRLVENLGRLDWPADKLEVIILAEEEDDDADRHRRQRPTGELHRRDRPGRSTADQAQSLQRRSRTRTRPVPRHL